MDFTPQPGRRVCGKNRNLSFQIMKNRCLNDSHGFALVLTLLIVSLITALTLQFDTAMRLEIESAAELSTGNQLRCAAESGFHYALSVLYEDALEDASSPNPHDSNFEVWANPNDLNAEAASGFEDATFEVTITDLSARINVNLVTISPFNPNPPDQSFCLFQQDVLKRLIESLDPDFGQTEIDDLVDSLVDWIDPDDAVTNIGGAENAYYQGLSQPYDCKNAPLESLDELLLVKGMTPELFEKIRPYLTIFGDGQVNINTATPRVLASLDPDMDMELADEMIEYRMEEDNDITNSGWYGNVSGISAKGIQFANAVVSSTCFRIVSTGKKDNMSKVIVSEVERDGAGPSLRILSRKME